MPKNDSDWLSYSLDDLGAQLFGAQWDSIKDTYTDINELYNIVNQAWQQSQETGVDLGVSQPPPSITLDITDSGLQQPPPQTEKAESFFNKTAFKLGDFDVKMWMLIAGAGAFILLRK